MEPQLYMWAPLRRHMLERHDAYVEAVRMRVMSQFRDIDAEAEQHASATWQALIEQPAAEADQLDMGELAEAAHDAGLAKYETLSFLKREIILGSLAGLYHIWERSLREFLLRECRHWLQLADVKKCAWESSLKDIIDQLRKFGWEVTAQPFHADIDACRLIVNVYKHGRGKSLDELAERYPRYLRYHGQTDLRFLSQFPDHDDLQVTEREFEDIAASLRAFWTAFPERLPEERLEKARCL